MEDGGPRVDTALGNPAPALRGRVAYHGYDMRGLPPGTHRGLPSPYLTLIVTFGTPLVMRGVDGALTSHDTVLGGLHRSPETIVHGDRQSGVHVVLDPLAARALLGRPAAELAGITVDTTDVLGAAGRELRERVDEAPDWAGRFAVLDDVLARHLRTGRVDVPAEVRRAWRSLVGSGGRRSVRSVAHDVGWSDRHLGQRFRAELGIAPKLAGRMARFDRARRVVAARAAAGRPLGLADVAVDGGYADQAHLTREFSELAGCPPTRWVAEEIGNLQDAPPPEGSVSSA